RRGEQERARWRQNTTALLEKRFRRWKVVQGLQQENHVHLAVTGGQRLGAGDSHFDPGPVRSARTLDARRLDVATDDLARGPREHPETLTGAAGDFEHPLPAAEF